MITHKKQKTDEVGASHVITIIVLVAVIAIGFVAYRVGVSQDQPTEERNQTANNDEKMVTEDNNVPDDTERTRTEDWVLVRSADTSAGYSVRVPETLLPSGTCASGEILFGIIYNSDNYDYDCSDLRGALSYASIVFGTSESSVVSELGAAEETNDVVLADANTTASKHVITTQENSPGGPVTVRYVVYEADSQAADQNYYAVYKTLAGASDEDYYLQDFEATVTEGWAISQ